MIVSGVLKVIGSGFEFSLGIPGLGEAFIISLLWIPLLLMLTYHIITLVLSRRSNQRVWGPIMGIIASTVGFIPVIGMILHWAAFICLLLDGILTLANSKRSSGDIVV